MFTLKRLMVVWCHSPNIDMTPFYVGPEIMYKIWDEELVTDCQVSFMTPWCPANNLNDTGL